MKQEFLTHFSIDFSSSVPVYEQVKKQMKQAIARKTLVEDDLLPSQRGLATMFKINPNTVARAYRDLVQEGIIHGRTGKGYRVNRFENPEEERLTLLKEKLSRFLEEIVAMGFTAQDVKGLIENFIERAAPAAQLTDLSRSSAHRGQESSQKNKKCTDSSIEEDKC